MPANLLSRGRLLGPCGVGNALRSVSIVTDGVLLASTEYTGTGNMARDTVWLAGSARDSPQYLCVFRGLF